MEKTLFTPQEEVNSLVEKALVALNDYASYTQEQIDHRNDHSD